MRLAPHVQVGGLTENPTMPLYTARYEVTAMIGIELYNRLIDAGHSIPTILVTAYPNDVEHACSRLSHGAGNTRGSHRNELTGVARQLDRHAMRAEPRGRREICEPVRA